MVKSITLATFPLVMIFLILFLTLSVVRGESITPPHIIFVLTDDLGWNFPGYRNIEKAVKTPTLDNLALKEGIRLNSAYMYKYCSPSRGSFMTGRYPWNLVSTRCNLIPSTIPEGVHLDYTFLPKHLAKAGYVSIHIGKWHLGFHKKEYTPVARGFNHSMGFLEGGEDHWSHLCGAGKAKCNVPGTPKNNKKYWDLWSQDTNNFPGAPLYGYNGTKNDTKTYSGYIFSNHATQFIRNHNKSIPMFMYLSLHNTHGPIEAPERFVKMYDFGDDIKKNTFFGMVSVVDETVKNVTDALQEKGMWENTLLVWTTDNGSPVQVAGSNAPLRGGKGSNWEGGIHIPAFVTGGVVPKSMYGQALPGLVHVSDWYATFSAVAGLEGAAEKYGPAPPNSINMWPYLTGQISDSPRTELIHDHHMFTNASAAYGCVGQNPFEMPNYSSLGAIRSGKYKLIIGVEHRASWYGQFSPNTTTKPDLTATACSDKPCLFDIESDPNEHVDIASTNPNIVLNLWTQFNKSNTVYHPPVLSPAQDIKGFCQAVLQHEGWVAPWLSDN